MHKINIIVAMDKNGGIGKDGKTPWQGMLRDDMDHFRDTTMGKNVGMGRKTWDSLPPKWKPLPGRENFILTRNGRWRPSEACHVIHNIGTLVTISTVYETWIIGGAEIYKLFLPHTKKMLITHIDSVFDCDTFFPVIDLDEWKFEKLFEQEVDKRNHFSFRVVEYTR